MRLDVPKDEHWIPLADLMTGMMMLFMLIAILFMLQSEEKATSATETAEILDRSNKNIERIVSVYNATKEKLYNQLKQEFEKDLPRWQAHLEPDLTIRFDNLQVMFATGKADLKQEFQDILSDFFPRYVAILTSADFHNLIEDIRIEGHTSTLWQGQKSEDDAYIKNMALSQDRTRFTLQYLLGLPQLNADKKWLMARLTANGLSSSRPRLKDDGTENQIGSQRVEFRVRTNSEGRIAEIIKEFSH